jgi:hypothetical protein
MKTTVFPVAMKHLDRCPPEWQLPAETSVGGRAPGRASPDSSRLSRVSLATARAVALVTRRPQTRAAG